MRRFVHGFIALGLLTATSISAQQQAEQGGQAAADKDAAGIIAVLAVENCFTSGSGQTFLKVCISENGNVSWLESPAGFVHLKSREGYAVCSYDASMTVHGFDVNSAAEGWGPATVSDNKRIITRTSLDGMIQLKQTFSVVPAWRGVDVKMEIKNLSPVSLPDLLISRYFDADVDGNTINETRHGQEASWLTASHSLMLVAAQTANVSLYPFAKLFSDWNPLGGGEKLGNSCSFGVAASGLTGDYVGGLTTRFANVKPGQTQTLTLGYRRF